MRTVTTKKILDQYEVDSDLYGGYGVKLSELITELLEAANISVHSVAYRCKEKDSLKKKLGKQGASYTQLSDITDICGLRVITYFEDDVKLISKILNDEFSIDSKNSSDKAELLDPDRFGYLSVHYVISNGETRKNLIEYKKFNNLKAEIQVRSILQHAWAEIEHDLGYKSRDGIPKSVRRRFSRLAGILELADQEFRTIREELTSYSNQVLGIIEQTPAQVDLNTLSLKAFIENSEDIKRIDLAIVKIARATIQGPFFENYETEVARMNFFRINNINDLNNAIEANEKDIEKFATRWLGSDDYNAIFEPGITLFYLAYTLLLKNNSGRKRVKEYIYTFFPDSDDESHDALVQRLIDVGNTVWNNTQT